MTKPRRRTQLALPLLSLLAACAGSAPSRPTTWSLADERAHIARREDPSTWDMPRMAEDYEPEKRARPMLFGAFPVPHYKLTGKDYKGGGNRLTFTPWRDRQLIGMGYFMGANEWNAPETGERDNLVFVHFLLPMAEMPSENNINLGGKYLSRNHPHLTAQGWFAPGGGEIEYMAFQTANGEAWAMVNLRLFDLRAGRCILIAPQPDGTLRTMQIDAPPLGPEEMQAYHTSLLERPEVEAFFATSVGG